MKPAIVTATVTDVEALPSSMGSEYMDARSYLKQPARAARVRPSDPDFHGSNASEFGATTTIVAETE